MPSRQEAAALVMENFGCPVLTTILTSTTGIYYIQRGIPVEHGSRVRRLPERFSSSFHHQPLSIKPAVTRHWKTRGVSALELPRSKMFGRRQARWRRVFTVVKYEVNTSYPRLTTGMDTFYSVRMETQKKKEKKEID